METIWFFMYRKGKITWRNTHIYLFIFKTEMYRYWTWHNEQMYMCNLKNYKELWMHYSVIICMRLVCFLKDYSWNELDRDTSLSIFLCLFVSTIFHKKAIVLFGLCHRGNTKINITKYLHQFCNKLHRIIILVHFLECELITIYLNPEIDSALLSICSYYKDFHFSL